MTKTRVNQKKVIFMSHAHDDSAQAEALQEWLNDNLMKSEWEIFRSTDRDSMSAGDEWHNKIREKLKQTVIVLCLLSKNSINRKWLYYEAGATILTNVPVVPVCFGGVNKHDLQFLPIQSFQAVEIPNREEENRLFEVVAKAAGLEPPKSLLEKIPDLVLPDFQPSRNSNPYSEWLFSEEELIQHENKFDGREIWVVSANLDHDVTKGPLARVVRNNLLKRSKSYTYVVPNKPELYLKIQKIENLYALAQQKPLFVQLKREEFDNITETNITIYNPRPSVDSGDDFEVFTELPIALEASKRCWVKMHKHFAQTLIGRIGTLVDEVTSVDRSDRAEE